jgi:hypothetical protein
LTIVGAGRVLSLFYEIRMLILHFWNTFLCNLPFFNFNFRSFFQSEIPSFGSVLRVPQFTSFLSLSWSFSHSLSFTKAFWHLVVWLIGFGNARIKRYFFVDIQHLRSKFLKCLSVLLPNWRSKPSSKKDNNFWWKTKSCGGKIK